MNEINWDTSIEAYLLAGRIARRAAEKLGLDHMKVNMDLIAVHANGCPLRLADLLAADDFNFAHDVLGITSHIDRRSGELLDCFVPRFAAGKENDQ